MQQHREPEPDVWGLRRPGVDGSREVRPGVPREWDVPADTGAPWDVPPQQAGVAARGRRGNPRARVFGTGEPARGASGALRRLAYRVPEHRASRWALLLVADRVEAAGGRLRRGAWLVPALGALWLGFALASRGLRRAGR